MSQVMLIVRQIIMFLFFFPIFFLNKNMIKHLVKGSEIVRGYI